jgi:3-hydroxybutyryl-CoA dehydrogenase
MKLETTTGRPAQVAAPHFVDPVHVLELVELVPSLVTSSDTKQRALAFVERHLAKQVIRARHRSGFVAITLLIPGVFGAIRMLESSFARRNGNDQGIVLGCVHPMGPLRLAELTGWTP